MPEQPKNGLAPNLRRLAGVAMAALLAAGCGSPSPTPTTPVGPVTEQPAVEDEAPPPREVDLDAFVSPDANAWQTIAQDPTAAVGEQVVVFAEVTQFDGATGPSAFRAYVGPSQPSMAAELATNTMLRGHAELLAGVQTGDVVRVHAEVVGGTGSGSRVTPELEVFDLEVVGYRDLAEDVELSQPVRNADGSVDVPATITNSSHRTMDYRVDLVAENASGTVHMGTSTARLGFLGAGQSAATTVTFREALPSDAVIKLAAVSRTPS